jgi:hypothetical protein
MAHHPRYQRSLDELFLHVYVYIDDWLKPYQTQLPKHSRQKASISELLTIAVMVSCWLSRLRAPGIERAKPGPLALVHWVVQQRFQDLFPSLPEYSRYHRVLRNAEPLLAGLALSWTKRHPERGLSASVISKRSQLHLIDSKPLPIAKGKRAEWAKLPEAAKGFSTMGMVFGFKLHALTDEQGLFEKWAFAPANHSDVTLAGELLEGMSNQLVVGDKAYIGSTACTPKRKNMAQEGDWQGWMSGQARKVPFCPRQPSAQTHRVELQLLGALSDPPRGSGQNLRLAQNARQPQDCHLQPTPLRGAL